MPRHSNFPTLYDECRTIKISDLKKWGYIMPGQTTSGNYCWFQGETKTAWISFTVNMFSVNSHIELDYKCNGTPINYSLQIVSIPSNIGRGNLLYFLCPVTGKRCRKLYSVGLRFLHRKAFSGCFYEKQTYSKRNRGLNKAFEMFFGIDNSYEQIYSKYFKKEYNGKVTKRYRKIMKRLNDSSRISEREIN
jgi:hypothetical protein